MRKSTGVKSTVVSARLRRRSAIRCNLPNILMTTRHPSDKAGEESCLWAHGWLHSYFPPEEPRNIVWIQQCANSPLGLGGSMNPGTRRVLRIIPKFYQMSIGVSAEGFLWAQRIDNSFISTPLFLCVFTSFTVHCVNQNTCAAACLQVQNIVVVLLQIPVSTR